MNIPMGPATAFAEQGFEKMLYDARMGPVALVHKNMLYVAWGGGNDGLPRPHIRSYDMEAKRWSGPVIAGPLRREAPDHHQNPVIWMDAQERLHMIYGVHCCAGVHVYTPVAGDITKWVEGPQIAPDITYPKILKTEDGTLVMFYRVLAHMGFWTYITSRDGGFSWTKPKSLIDLDRDPVEGEDDWASTYHNARLSRDGKSLHLGFVYFHERGMYNWLHPKYGVRPHVQTRFDLYYARVDIASGTMFDMDGNPLPRPLNRRMAEQAKIWDTGGLGGYLTNIPSLYLDEQDHPSFLLVRSNDSGMRDCNFWYLQRKDGVWTRSVLAKTNSTWAGSCIHKQEDGKLAAYLIASEESGENLIYGGGNVEKWVSFDGVDWSLEGKIDPSGVEGFIYNNPMFAEKSDGSGPDDRFLLMFGWQGPEALCPPVGPASYINGKPPVVVNKAKAYVAFEGEWI